MRDLPSLEPNKQTHGLLGLPNATCALTSPAGGAFSLNQLQNDKQTEIKQSAQYTETSAIL